VVRRAVILVLLALAACGHSFESSAPNRAGHGSSATREVVEALSPSERAALTRAFETTNPGWKVLPSDYPQYRRDLVAAAQRETRGPRRAVTAPEAEARARALLVKNAALLSVLPADAASLRASVVPYPAELLDAEHHPFLVELSGTLVRPGFEGFPNVARTVQITMTIRDDGEPDVITTNVPSADRPDLHIRTQPRLPAERAPTQVEGRTMFRYDPVGSVPGRYDRTYRKQPIGAVTKEEIRGVRLAIIVDFGHLPQQTFFLAYLAYEVTVVKGDLEGIFLVDPDSGAVIRDPEPPRGPIVP
jgi:hypothetical protein